MTKEEDKRIQKEINCEWTIGELKEDLVRAEKEIDQLEKDKQELIEKLKESHKWLEGSYIFISSREKMHPCGVDMHKKLCKSIEELLK